MTGRLTVGPMRCRAWGLVLALGLTATLAAAAFAQPAPSQPPSPAPARRPLVVILTEPEGTVATDVFTPYAILAESGAVEVKVVSPTAAPVRLTPGVAWLAPQMTLAQLARERPAGPDVVVVPAMEDEDDPARARWLREQLKGGARIMSICNGARVLAAAGVLDGRQATVHWFSQGRMRSRHPKAHWRRDARWVSDGPVLTTAGISAGEPGSLELLRELAGEAVMRKTAARIGLAAPDPRHDGRAFHLTPGRMAVTVCNVVAFWNHDDVSMQLHHVFDEHAFGVALDAWSRTYRSKAWAEGAPATVSRHGLKVFRARRLPADFDRRVPLPQGDAMTATFQQLRRAYGDPTARFVAVQFEHPWGLARAK